MKYCIRIIAILPALTIGIISIILFVLAFDYKWLIVPCITNSIGFVMLLDKYEESVKDLINLIKILCNKTPIYNV